MYNTGKKLTKVEKREKEAKEMELKKKKLSQLGQQTKVEKQEKKDKEPRKEEGDAQMDTDDMPLFISNTDSDNSMKGAKKKCIINKKLTKPPPEKKVTLRSYPCISSDGS